MTGERREGEACAQALRPQHAHHIKTQLRMGSIACHASCSSAQHDAGAAHITHTQVEKKGGGGGRSHRPEEGGWLAFGYVPEVVPRGLKTSPRCADARRLWFWDHHYPGVSDSVVVVERGRAGGRSCECRVGVVSLLARGGRPTGKPSGQSRLSCAPSTLYFLRSTEALLSPKHSHAQGEGFAAR